ncbi:hypothetical protein ADUPG1_008562 [Aduncisulcus paluster]|uniref:Uncharacterized protein n=1 Tax=Aduncisulcus paluster TaxID=2918883 RepID=A0ABQ5KSF2_9EUKA|nr:hypothetical protein ADUPG1_008562 [Aduncisulcus paluster]
MSGLISGELTSSSLCSSDRIYRLSMDSRQRKYQQRKDEYEKKELESCTFTPKINHRSSMMSDSRTLRDRVDDLSRSKKHKKFLQRKYQSSQQSFTPQISQYSKRLAESRVSSSSTQPVHERLIYEGKVRDQKRRKLREEIARKTARECTFTPSLAKGSQDLSSSSFPNSSFQDRQQKFVKKRESIHQQMKLQASKDFTFTPQIVGDGRPSTVDVVERLSESGSRIKQIRNARQLKYSQGMSFTPSIDSHSKQLASKRTFNPDSASIFSSADEIKFKRRERCKEYEDIMKLKCPFTPSLRDSQHRVYADSLLKQERIQETLDEIQERKMLKNLSLMKQKQDDETRECSFHPKLISSPPSRETFSSQVSYSGYSSAPSSVTPRTPRVQGVSKHVERQMKGRRLREEKKRALEWCPGSSSAVSLASSSYAVTSPVRSDPPVPCTVQTPFKLSIDPLAYSRRRQAEEDARKSKYGECSFTPKTLLPREDILMECLDREE